MSPRGPSGASKSQKAAFSKTYRNLVFLKVFGSRGLPRKPQEAQEGSQEAPKEFQNFKKRDPKLDPKINTFWINFEAILPRMALKKVTKNGTIFGTPFPRISEVQITPRQKLNERGEKPTLTGIILSKRKGGIRPYRAL